MIPSETIRSILASAVQAPSGENAQPWRFEVERDRISVFNVPENDRSLYNFRQRASYISHGAVIENIVIAAAHFDLAASVAIGSKIHAPDLIATISLAPSGVKEDASLYPYIEKRCTNRKMYNGGTIPTPVIDALVGAAKNMDAIQVRFLKESSAIKQLATIASVNDTLLLENRSLHDFFFSHVHWTLEEELKQRSGFYIEVLELLPPAKALFRLFQYWPIMRIFNALGAGKMGAKENSKIYASASAIGIITVSNETLEDFIDAGRTLQKLWLLATSNGMSMQPLTGVLFFHQRVHVDEAQEFSLSQKEAVEKAYEGIRSAFAVEQGTITMMFRIGYAEAPTATSLKKSPEVIFK